MTKERTPLCLEGVTLYEPFVAAEAPFTMPSGMWKTTLPTGFCVCLSSAHAP